jgi:hypothetical protein
MEPEYIKVVNDRKADIERLGKEIGINRLLKDISPGQTLISVEQLLSLLNGYRGLDKNFLEIIGKRSDENVTTRPSPSRWILAARGNSHSFRNGSARPEEGALRGATTRCQGGVER